MPDKMRVCGCDDAALDERLLSVEQAINIAISLVSPVSEAGLIALADSLGRIAAQDIFAPSAMPFFDNSAMDGFAVRTADFTGSGPWVLPERATVAAGDASPPPLPKGYVDRIFTGAPIPAGCDAVLMIEKTRQSENGIRFDHAPKLDDNIRQAGGDMDAGTRLLRAGTRIAPHHVGLLAANGVRQLHVMRALRVGVLSTGDEVTDTERGAGQIYDANRPMLCALAARAGADVSDLGILPDDLAVSSRCLAQIAGDYDLVLSSGAVSMGDRDFMRPALAAAGGVVEGWRAALKPGKPVMFGRLGRTAITGLPGNPLATLVGFHLFARAQIRRLSGQAARPFAATPAVAGFSWRRKAGRDEVFPVKLSHYAPSGAPVLMRLGRGASAALLPVGEADGLAVVPGRTVSMEPGDRLRWQPFENDI